MEEIKPETFGSNLPEKKFRAGAVCATVWHNTGKTKEGKETEYRTVSLDRAYMDKNGEWQHTNSLRLNDLPRIEAAIRRAYEYLIFECTSKQSDEAA